MSLGLAFLGQELCKESEERQSKLNKLSLETWQGIKMHQTELKEQSKLANSKRQKTISKIRIEVTDLLIGYKRDKIALIKSLREQRNNQSQNLKSWIRECSNELKSFQDAINYTRKPIK